MWIAVAKILSRQWLEWIDLFFIHRLMRILALPVLITLLFTSCSVSKQLQRSAQENVLRAEDLKTAHVGISVFEPATGKYWFNHQGDKYFVPASNTKLPTCYAAMKYLGDSLVGLKVRETENQIFINGTGDPSFLHPDFKKHPVFNYLQVLTRSGKPVWFYASF